MDIRLVVDQMNTARRPAARKSGTALYSFAHPNRLPMTYYSAGHRSEPFPLPPNGRGCKECKPTLTINDSRCRTNIRPRLSIAADALVGGIGDKCARGGRGASALQVRPRSVIFL